MLPSGELTRDELRFWSRYIRDVLSPMIRNSGVSDIKAQELNELEAFLDKVSVQGSVDKETLRFSKLHIALMAVASTGSGWMQNVVLKADELLERWDRDFGPLLELRSDLWGPGGRLHGLKRLTEPGMDAGNYGLDVYVERKLCVSVPVGLDDSLCTGELGFEVGEYAAIPLCNLIHQSLWWIRPAAAFRDGIIDGSIHGVTTDGVKAYAILMTGFEELSVDSNGTIKYRADCSDPGRFRLMENLMSRDPVRVLRTWKLTSKYKPRTGVRYDGLYRVTAQGTRLSVTEKGDEWQLTFDLERLPGQKSMEMAVEHPAADEMDDWNLYQREKQLTELERRPGPRSKRSISLLEAIASGSLSEPESGLISRTYSWRSDQL